MGFKAKHRERDLALPNHRQKLLTAIEHDLITDKHVLAVFYGGSLGSQKTDLYSDIDLRVVVKDDVFEEFRLDKKQRAKNWGKVLFYEDFPWTTITLRIMTRLLRLIPFIIGKWTCNHPYG